MAPNEFQKNYFEESVARGHLRIHNVTVSARIIVDLVTLSVQLRELLAFDDPEGDQLGERAFGQTIDVFLQATATHQ
ncbi:TetR/AcrR family transcriptional regulator C-terminal domain-containing protein [Mycobacterium paraintracellulare]|uniref:TetR/AcrR family transcriptional regulator C-terminal domain-containing protein n=1 Tax=Mycobacterium paraintracellulare TaxID=1138383 RepID=UPI001927E296|nr:TetR/AcrR family transcriptional regulator C-terminal domain-containing protein [Mycobacterium paraintracellulare]WVL47920.1 TetR/AcrR family transcriptional regulator C-terminal domain-containing protein [Mycobacterium paraintracellulare]BCO38937.1 hypothetical protein MINTM001_00760 [Mycobacterium paraintracellulare]